MEECLSGGAETPEVSIVVPVHNGAATVGRCLSSLQAQTVQSYELIFVDDGSTDGTREVLEGLLAGCDNARVVAQQQAGVSAARNRGIAEARGKYLLFVDADDTVSPALLEKTLATASSPQAQMTIFGFFEYYDSDGVRLPRELCRQQNLFGRSFHLAELEDTSTTLVTPNVWRILWDRRFVAENELLFHEDLGSAEDLAFIYEAFCCNPSLALVEDRLYFYHRDEASTLTRSERGDASLRALNYIREFGSQGKALDDNLTYHFVNLILDTLQYALATAYSLQEYRLLFEGYQKTWASWIGERADKVAPRYRPFFEAMAAKDPEAYLFDLFREQRSLAESRRVRVAKEERSLKKIKARVKKCEARVRQLERKPLNRVASRLRRVLKRK